MMNRRIWAVLLALALCAGLFSAALAETEYAKPVILEKFLAAIR